jgi:PadR family transcriptional regulator AphA
MPHETEPSPQPALLGFLMGEPMHGYELHQQFSQGLGRVWQIGLSQMYAQLKQLEEAGLVGVQLELQATRPPRKVYHLTEEGRAVFLEWLHRPTPYVRRMRVEFLARVYLFHRLGLPGLDELVSQQRAVCQEQVEHFRQLTGEEPDPFRRLVLEFRLGQLQAVISWLERCTHILGSA